MKVILTKDVDTLGDSGDVLSVADGYARNYLFPKNLAVEATDGAMRDLQARIERIRAKAEKKHQEDLIKAEKVTGLDRITLEANAGETGKLFGAITTKELARVITEKTGLEVERKQLNVNAPINRVGDYVLNVKFSSKVSASVNVTVKATQSEAERMAALEAKAAFDEAEALAEDEDFDS